MPCARGRINNWNWVETNIPITDLRGIYLALRELDLTWNNNIPEIENWYELRERLTQPLPITAEMDLLFDLSNRIEQVVSLGSPELNLSNGFRLSWAKGSYRIGTNSGKNVDTFSQQLSKAYRSSEANISDEMERTLRKIETAQSTLAAEHANALRLLVENQRKAIELARQQLIDERMNHIEAAGNSLGYTVRKRRIGKKIKYVLSRQP